MTVTLTSCSVTAARAAVRGSGGRTPSASLYERAGSGGMAVPYSRAGWMACGSGVVGLRTASGKTGVTARVAAP